MARVRPFAAYRYGRPERDISALTAPPYDVICPAQREALLAGDPDNIVALELPSGPLDPAVPGNRYETGAAVWADWRSRGVMVRDDHPAVYVLEQRFDFAGHPVRRRAFIVEVGLEPFDAGVVLPHERTLPRALGDRFELTRATAANLSQVFGLFDDAAGETDELFDRATAGEPLSTAVDADGVESTIWAVTDPGFSATLQSFFADKPLFIADGHHRYTTALAYRDLRREQALAAGVSCDRPRLRLRDDGAREHGGPGALGPGDPSRGRRRRHLRRRCILVGLGRALRGGPAAWSPSPTAFSRTRTARSTS